MNSTLALDFTRAFIAARQENEDADLNLSGAQAVSISRFSDHDEEMGDDVFFFPIAVSISGGGQRDETSEMKYVARMMVESPDGAYALVCHYSLPFNIPDYLAFAISVPGQPIVYWTYHENGATEWRAPEIEQWIKKWASRDDEIAQNFRIRGFID